MSSYILTLSCTDRPGIVATITTKLAEIGSNIAESNQYWDKQTGQFFMRIAFSAPDNSTSSTINDALAPAVAEYGMDMSIADQAETPKIVIMVSKFDHALRNLLYQIRVGRLRAEIVAVVSNHPDVADFAAFENIPFHHWPVGKTNRAEQEQMIFDLVEKSGADLVVLARYMQILSDDLSTRLFGKIINIHHSFLPSFKGAKPYHQAHERGVKLIGATAHYVTPDLDEGPIIEQDIARITHGHDPDEMIAEGRDIESRVLARAVRLHLEHRVMLNGHKTVVFAS